MVGDTVGRGRHARSVRNGGDGAQRLGRLEVGHGFTIRAGVKARGGHIFTVTHFKGTVLGIVRSIVCTPKTIVNVLAICTWSLALRVTDLQTESMTAHEADVG